MGWFPLGLGLVVEDRPPELSCWYLTAGPPPAKKGRLQSDESAFSTDPSASHMSSKANNTSLVDPSSTALTRVPKTEAAIGLDTKLGIYNVP